MPAGGKCSRCGYPVLWVELLGTGKKIPVNPGIDDLGTVVAQPIAGVLRGRIRRRGDKIPAGHDLYLVHFATCPVRDRERMKTSRPLYLFDQPQVQER